MSLPNLPALLAEVRDLTTKCHGGGRASIDAFCDLLSLIFRLTVVQANTPVCLDWGTQPVADRVKCRVAGGWDKRGLLPLRNGKFLRLIIGVFLDQTANDLLKVDKSSLQYQCDEAGESWVCRYEYARDPEGRHPAMHLHVRGALAESDALPADRPLERVHFPTNRVSCEAMIRLLVEQFNVSTNYPREIWQPVLAFTEAEFLRRAHLSSSGPG